MVTTASNMLYEIQQLFVQNLAGKYGMSFCVRGDWMHDRA